MNLALLYIRNGNETVFPVQDINHALSLADNIANSDLLNDSIDFNLFDVLYYKNGKLGDSWESEDGLSFDEFWVEWRDRNS